MIKKIVWFYIIVSTGGDPVGVLVRDTQKECWRDGLDWILERKIEKTLATCVPSNEVDEKYPNLGWM